MTPIAAILILLLLAAVILLIAGPLRGHQAGTTASAGDSEADAATDSKRDAGPAAAAVLAREELEAAREAKYREIRDSELDFRTGKLSRDDYAAIDAQLRAEAIDILDRLEQLAPPGEQDRAEDA